MRVSELKSLLTQFNDNDLVVIENTVITGVSRIRGKSNTTDSKGNSIFRPNDKGDVFALKFIRLQELSDGKIYDVVI